MLTLEKDRDIAGRIEVNIEISGSTVSNVSVRGDLVRDLGVFLKGKKPGDALISIGQIFSVCPGSHQHAFALAVEQASGKKPSDHAITMRNIIEGLQFLQSHIFWFYCTALTDYIDLERTLKLVSRKSSLREKLKKIESLFSTAGRGKQALFFGGHPLYSVYDELSLDLISHSLDALSHIGHLMIWGRKLQDALPGLGPLWEMTSFIDEIKCWIDRIFLSDAEELYKIKGCHDGKGTGYYLSLGVFEDETCEPDKRLFPRAVYTALSEKPYTLSQEESDVNGINLENMEHGCEDLMIKPFEVGPLARVATAFQNERMEISGLIKDIFPGLKESNVYEKLSCPEGRVLARAIECSVLAQKIPEWVNTSELEARVSNVDDTMIDREEASGTGLWEAPRGALEHRVELRDMQLHDCRSIIPTTWNFRPGNTWNMKSPVEKALLGLEIAEPERPLEILRIVRSFDPCVPCTVRVIEPVSKKILEYNIA